MQDQTSREQRAMVLHAMIEDATANAEQSQSQSQEHEQAALHYQQLSRDCKMEAGAYTSLTAKWRRELDSLGITVTSLASAPLTSHSPNSHNVHGGVSPNSKTPGPKRIYQRVQPSKKVQSKERLEDAMLRILEHSAEPLSAESIRQALQSEGREVKRPNVSSNLSRGKTLFRLVDKERYLWGLVGSEYSAPGVSEVASLNFGLEPSETTENQIVPSASS